MMHIFRKGRAEEIDEHDLPTEPIRYMEPAPFTPTLPPPNDATIPVPQPQPSIPGNPAQQTPRNNGVYPYLPATPVMPDRRGERIGDTVPVRPARRARANRTRRSPIPALVGLCFVCIQLLLLAHFVLRLVNVSASVSWAGAVYQTGDIFLWPLRLITQQVTLPLPANIEVLTLLAILVYGLLSRLLVRVLKALVKSQSTMA